MRRRGYILLLTFRSGSGSGGPRDVRWGFYSVGQQCGYRMGLVMAKWGVRTGTGDGEGGNKERRYSGTHTPAHHR